jgi:archaellum biogenesis protein FlaJ (TadC family)
MEKHSITYEKCRLDEDFGGFVYGTCIFALAAGVLVLFAGAGVMLLASLNGDPFWSGYALPIGILAIITIAPAVLYGRLWSIASLRNYRGALVDTALVHAVGLMLAMASFNVPVKRIFQNLSNLPDVYGTELALEATYVLAIIDEEGMDVVSAMRKAQATSPSALWQELLIGITMVYSSGGILKEYLDGRYRMLGEKKMLDMRRYNETIQGMASVYLSVVGIASIFVAIMNLVFNMTGMVSGNAFVWIDAIVIVPLGSFILARVLKAASPEA